MRSPRGISSMPDGGAPAGAEVYCFGVCNMLVFAKQISVKSKVRALVFFCLSVRSFVFDS